MRWQQLGGHCEGRLEADHPEAVGRGPGVRPEPVPEAAFHLPACGSPKYILLQEQAIDFLAEQSRAHQADAKIGVPPQDRIVSDAAFRKVTARIRVTADLHRTKRQLDLGTATEIRMELLKKRRAAVMHGFVAAGKRDYPVTYAPGYEPVSEIVLARKVWAASPSGKRCDLPPGSYQLPTAIAHGCAKSNGEVVPDVIPCSIVDLPGPWKGFSGAEENDGFAEYSEDNAGTCQGDPRDAEVQVTAPAPQVQVSYLPQTGTATYTDPLLGVTLRYYTSRASRSARRSPSKASRSPTSGSIRPSRASSFLHGESRFS